MVSLQAGGAAFTDFQRATATPTVSQLEVREIRRRVSARTTSSFGAGVALWLGDAWGVRAGVSYLPSYFTVHHDEAAILALDEDVATGATQYAGLGVLLADASLLFRSPYLLGRVVPYGIIGAGLVHYWKRDGGELPPEARTRFTDATWTGPAAVVGIGAAIPLQMRNLMLTFELTDHIGRTPLDDRGAGEQFHVNGVELQLEPEDVRSDTDGVGRTNTVRLMVGLTLPIR